MQLRTAVLCCALAAVWLQPAAAQQPPRQQPTDPAATVPPARYSSAFAGYQPLRDEKPTPWREVNDEVARVGGHLGMFGGGAHSGHGEKPASATTGGATATRPGAPK